MIIQINLLIFFCGVITPAFKLYQKPVKILSSERKGQFLRAKTLQKNSQVRWL
jgi:hypothetical protein